MVMSFSQTVSNFVLYRSQTISSDKNFRHKTTTKKVALLGSLAAPARFKTGNLIALKTFARISSTHQYL